MENINYTEVFFLFLFLANFVLLPIWYVIFFIGYFLQKKGKDKGRTLMITSLVFSQIAIAFFYHQMTTIDYYNKINMNYELSLKNPFVLIVFLILFLTFIFSFPQFRKKYNLFLIPFLLQFAWILMYLYY